MRWGAIQQVNAEELPVKNKKLILSTSLHTITLKKGMTISSVEASGLTYFPELKSYVVVSDDTDRKRPELFFMDSTGYIGKKTIVKGLEQINDIESITQSEGGFCYLLASQSYNRKGKQSKWRRLCVKMRYNESHFEAYRSTFLIDELHAASCEDSSKEWSKFIKHSIKEKSVDIEGICWYNDTLLLGFKNPRIGHEAVIIAISRPDDFFEKSTLEPEQVSLWEKMALFDSTSNTFCGVSDLFYYKDRLYGLATGVRSQHGLSEDVGMFWCYNRENRSLQRLKIFQRIKPEGLTYNSDRNEFCITFDNGKKNPSQIMIVKVSL